MIPVFSRKFDKKDISAVVKSLKNNWVSANGPYSKKLKDGIKKKFNTKYVSLVSSGTAALECSLKAINVKKGDEIILPAFTIVSCLNVILRFGAIPIIVDVDKDTWLISESEIIKNISKKTKAIMVVHIFGNCFDVESLKKKINKKVYIIEDCAEAIGAKKQNKYVGTIGDIGTYSFYSNKTITSGEGGMVWTNNKKLFNRIEGYINLFFGKKERFDHIDIGFNYRMSDLQSALAYSQFKKFNSNIKKINKIASNYQKYLDNKLVIYQKNNNCSSVWWMIAIVLPNKIIANKLMNYLKSKEIDTRNLFKPLNRMKFLKIKKKDNKNSDYLYKHGLYLPSGFDLKLKEIKLISKYVNDFILLNLK